MSNWRRRIICQPQHRDRSLAVAGEQADNVVSLRRMPVRHLELKVSTRGNGDIHDLTDGVVKSLDTVGISDGTVTVFVPGSTAAVTTVEYEPGLLKDVPAAMERFAPRDIHYEHDDTWHDGNGYAHVRASAIGPSLTVPLKAGKLVLGTWQQIVLIDFDNRSRERRVTVTVMGE
jgi:secondary thiamine-phosphate synthase enzyme